MLDHERNEGQDKAVLSSLEIASILEGHLDTGYSVDRFGDSPHAGYAVGMPYAEMRLASRPIGRLIADWVQEQLNNCWEGYAIDWVFGVWHNKGHWYFDVSAIVPNKDDAIRIGESHKQVAIYDCAEQEEIRLDGSAELCVCGKPTDIPNRPCYDCRAILARHIANQYPDDPGESPREHVSGDPRVSVAEECRIGHTPADCPHRAQDSVDPGDETSPGDAGDGIDLDDPCKGCRYDGAERAGKCSVCPVTP